LRELSRLVDAQRARESITDWQTARIVAMVAAVNSKRRKYDPMRYMMNGAELKRRAREAAERDLPSGDELLRKIQRLGVRVIDNRQKV
jgi:hypothetical protein